MSDLLNLEFTRKSDAAVIKLRGRIDGDSSKIFKDFLGQHLGPEDRSVVLDGSDLTFISSAGLRELLNLAKRLKQHQCKPVIFGMKPEVALTLETGGFAALFHCTRNLESALEILAPKNTSKPGLLGRLFG